MTAAASTHGPKPELQWLPIARLSVDMAYQRSLESSRSQSLIARIAADFRWALFGTVMVAPLPLGSWELMDGQHRVAGARQAGIDQVPASIIAAPTIEERARIFRDANRQRVTMHAYALHHAGVKAGDPDAVAVAELCQQVDIEIPRYPIQQTNLKPNQCLSIATLKKLATEGSGHQALKTLRILRAAFVDQAGGLRAHLILGLREWVRLHPRCDELACATALQRYGLERLEKQVFSIGLAGNRRAEAVPKVLGHVIPHAASGGVQQAEAVTVRKPTPSAPLPEPRKLSQAPAFDPGRLTQRPVKAQPLKAGKR